MAINHLLRPLAPISDSTWTLLDQEARDRLTPALGARKLVDFSGPHGWQHSATDLGRTATLADAPSEGVTGAQRRVLALVELRADFELALEELRDADRGAADPDLEPLDRAAHQIACAENIAVFRGLSGVIGGIAQATPHQPIQVGGTAGEYPGALAGAIGVLLDSGIGGPYGLALAGEQYRRIAASPAQGGYPLLEHVRKIIDGPIVWVPGVEGAVVLSMRGGDFLFESGQDLAIGYAAHDAKAVALYLQESFSFRVATPEAAVVLSA